MVDVTTLTDQELADLAAEIQAEQRRRLALVQPTKEELDLWDSGKCSEAVRRLRSRIVYGGLIECRRIFEAH